MLKEIEIPLLFNDLGVDSKGLPPFKLADTVQPTYSVLTGRRGNQQWPLEVDGDNRLEVNPWEGKQPIVEDAGNILTDSFVLGVYDTHCHSELTWIDREIEDQTEILEDIYSILTTIQTDTTRLNDVFDPTDDAFRTKAV